jgi:Predicted O-methyltransferase
MPNPYFHFKQFTVYHQHNAMKVTTDACLFGAWVADEMQNGKCKMKNVLDIGTGTGLLSLIIVQKNNVRIDAIEIDKDSSDEAKENVLNSPWKENITVHYQDILKFQSGHLYDGIICNPPFYENEWTSDNSRKNTAHHSQHLSLKDVLIVVKTNLTSNGIFYLLLPAKRETKVKLMLDEMGLHIHKLITVNLSASNKRIMISGSKELVQEIETEQISVNGERFKNLLKDYYLYA